MLMFQNIEINDHYHLISGCGRPGVDEEKIEINEFFQEKNENG